MKIITTSTRYRVTVITRRDRENPFQMEIRDRLTGDEHREAIRDLTIRQRAEAYKRAAAREAELNGGTATTGPVSWAEARTKGEATIAAEKRTGTAMAYRKGLDALERYAEDALTCRPGPDGKRLQFLEQVTAVLARGFPGWRKAHGLTRNRKRVITVREATINRDLAQLHAFWGEYLVKLGIATANPWHGINFMRGFARQPVRLTYEQRAALLKEVEDLGLKFHAACALAAETGPRVGELCHVTWAHVDTRLGAWLITEEAGGWRPKGVCERLVRFSTETGRLLEDWRGAQVAELVGQGLDGDDAREAVNGRRVFGTGRKATSDNYERTFNHDLRRACRRVGVPEITCHELRYTVGRLMADAGAAPTAIKEVLGHAAIQTTMHYIGQGQPGGARAAFDALQRQVGANSVPRGEVQVEDVDGKTDVTRRLNEG